MLKKLFQRNSIFFQRNSLNSRKILVSSRRFFSNNSRSQNEFVFTWRSFGILAFIFGGAAAYYQIEKDKQEKQRLSQVEHVGKPSLGGPFVLFDQNGTPVTDATYRGQYILLYFGFTHCPDICPSELVKVGHIISELEKKKAPYEIKPIFISLDPHRDTIEQLKYYSQDFHPSYTFLTGTKKQIEQVARSYRVYFSKVDKEDDPDLEEDYLVDHSIVLYLLDKNGDFVDFFTQKMTAIDVAEKINKHMIELDKQ